MMTNGGGDQFEEPTQKSRRHSRFKYPVHTSHKLNSHQQLIVLKTSDTVQFALETFQERHFRSCPVQDESGAIAGFLDVLDIVAYLLSIFPRPTSGTGAFDPKQVDLLLSENRFSATTIKSAGLINFSRFNPWLSLPRAAPLEKAISIFATGIHHIALTEENKAVAVLSQSDIVRFMNADVSNRLGSLAKKTVKDLGFTVRRVKVVQVSSPAIDAFFAMQRAGLSCVAVVDASWKLVGNLSASDITILNSISFLDLINPLSTYLKKLEEFVYKYRPVIAVDENATFEHIIQLLCQNKIHHIWIIDSQDKPVGIITLTDVLSMALAVISGEDFAQAITPTPAKLELAQKAEAKRVHDAEAERYLAVKQTHERAPSPHTQKRLDLLQKRIRERQEAEEAADARARTGAILPPASASPAPKQEPTISPEEQERLALIRKRLQARLEKERQMESQYAQKLEAKPTQLEAI